MAQDAVHFPKLHQAFRRAERILLVADGSPDGDSIGATSAFYNWLRREGKINITVFCQNPLPSSLLFLDGAHDFTNDPSVFDRSYDLVVTSDMSDTVKFGFEKIISRLPAGFELWNIDHHATNSRFGKYNIVNTSACSTCEVIYDFFSSERITIDHRMATSLLTGIMYDTSFLSNGGTTIRGVEIGAKLMEAGARSQDVIKSLLHNKPLPSLKIWGLALSRLSYHPKHDVATTYFRAQDVEGVPGAEEAISGLSNFLNRLCGNCDAILVLKEKSDGTVVGSLRTINRKVSDFAKAFGGGGHVKASGFLLEGQLEEMDGHARFVRKTKI